MRSPISAHFHQPMRGRWCGPNFDTLYSIAWLDLTRGPVVVSAPDTGGPLLPAADARHVDRCFAVPGKRTTGTGAANFALVPPGWSGKIPAGVERIDAPTPYVWIIGRTQTNGPKDYDAVHKVQDGYKLTPLSRLGQDAAAGPAHDRPGCGHARPSRWARSTRCRRGQYFTVRAPS